MAEKPNEQTVVANVISGEVLDERWRVEKRIGQGAMGSVYKAFDLEANRTVALKILAPEHCRKPKVVARFEREAEKMTRLRHPNIVAFEGHGRRGALPFIVMEFLEGLTLGELMTKAGGKLELPETVAIIKQVAAGMVFLHYHGLVHRDLKPQNIFFARGGRVTILDLGVVRDQHQPGLTKPGAMVGTPYYMSPEQILGVEDIDRRTDIYALAAVTFELLTGRPPFLGANNFEVLFGHKNTPPPDASTLVKNVSKDVARVLMRGLAKPREQRPDSVTEFFNELEAAAGVARVDLLQAFQFSAKPKVRAKVQAPAASRPSDTQTSSPSIPTEEPQPEERPKEDTARVEAPEEPQLDPTVETGEVHVAVTLKGQGPASIGVDGRPQGEAPKKLTLSVGPHRIRIELEGHRTVERWVTVGPHTSTNLRIFLEKA